MGALGIWITAARPRTLPASIAPVAVGTAAAVAAAGGELPRAGGFMAALVASVLIQVGTNLANDYSDARRGADSTDRLGPVRVTSSGLAAPRRVLIATLIAFAAAICLGIYLTVLAGWPILAVGILSIAAGVLYTGGPRPYGYAGLGELFVLGFFGLVAVNGSYYVQLERLDWLPLVLSFAIGLMCSAILVVNNIRDMDTDRRAGKRTLAVILGRRASRRLFVATIASAYAALALSLATPHADAWLLLALGSAPLWLRPVRTVLERTDGPSLNRALADTGALLGAFSLLLAAGLLI